MISKSSEMDCTCSALRRAARRLTQVYDAALAPEGLTVSQYAVIGTLGRCAEGQRPTVQALAEMLGLDRTTLGHNLRPLERDGLVAVEPDAADRRQRRIRLTEAGSVKRDRCLPLWRDAQDRFDRAYGPDPARALRSSLMAVAEVVVPPCPAAPIES